MWKLVEQIDRATLTLLEPCITREMYKSAAGQLAASSIRAVEHMLHEGEHQYTVVP